MQEINHGSMTVVDPDLDEDEMPEKTFVVKDEEVNSTFAVVVLFVKK